MGRQRTQAAPKSVGELVLHALKLAATNSKAKWLGASAKALFSTKDANYEAAIAECTKPAAPFLKQVGECGALTTAGFAQVIEHTPKEQVAELTIRHATALDAPTRDAVYLALKSRTEGPAAELYYEAIRALDTEAEKQQGERAKRARRAKLESYRATIALQLQTENRLNQELALVRAEIKGLKATLSDMEAAEPEQSAVAEVRTERKGGAPPEPKTAEEKDFRRSECDRLAAAWRDAWDAKKDEGRDYLETAMWNIRGLRMIGEVGAKAAFDGRVHESDKPAFTGDAVTIVRPGWLLKEDGGDYVALKAAVATA